MATQDRLWRQYPAGAGSTEMTARISKSHAHQIGTRRELFVDDALIERFEGGAELRLHQPTRREVALRADRPWEGNMCGGITVFQDDGRYRMYYRGWSVTLKGSTGDDGNGLIDGPMLVCYAESDDGLEWRRPELGLVEFGGSKANNIVWSGAGSEQRGVHGFTPFKDANPSCPPGQRYKAVGALRAAFEGGLWAMCSPDGIAWSVMGEAPIFRQGETGRNFDSQNLAFWDASRGEYRAYFRCYLDNPDMPNGRCRAIRTAVSKDFVTWSEPEDLAYPGSPAEELYTNAVQPYPRAPHLYVGFPARYVHRPWSPAIEAIGGLEHRRQRADVVERFGSALTDGLFMTSRDGRTFRRWGEAFVRPGPQTEDNWAYGDNYLSVGLIETASDLPGAPDEYSLFATEGYWRDASTTFRRLSIRQDGFISLHAPLAGGGCVTEPLIFSGRSLRLNVATSAAGCVRVEIQSPDGTALPGFSLEECHEVIGDGLDRTVAWDGCDDVGGLGGQPVRLRIAASDADVFAFRFA